MMINVLVWTLRFRGHLVASQVLGSADNYDTEIGAHYPVEFRLPSTEANGWLGESVPTFNLKDLREAVKSYPEKMRHGLLGTYLDGDSKLYFNMEACHMPSIGELKAETVTLDGHVPDII